MTVTLNERSSFTADGIAYRRIFTGIPLSSEIWEALTLIHGQPPADELERMKNRQFLPFFEARYLMTDRELTRAKVKQVLELAPGLSGRGLNLTNHPDITYVEIDLPAKMALKREIINEMVKRHQITFQPNFHLEEGNVTNAEDFRRAVINFTVEKPVAVISEGLLRYLSISDREALSVNIFKLIRRAGGMWITPDIEFLNDINNIPENRIRYDKMAKEAGFDVRSNLFRDEAHALSFFEGFGFAVKKYSLSEMTNLLVCPQKLNISKQDVADALRNRWTYVME